VLSKIELEGVLLARFQMGSFCFVVHLVDKTLPSIHHDGPPLVQSRIQKTVSNTVGVYLYYSNSSSEIFFDKACYINIYSQYTLLKLNN